MPLKFIMDYFFGRQEAILAAISEKDAHIAVLETSGANTHKSTEVKRLNKEKEKLQAQLKDLVSVIMPTNKKTYKLVIWGNLM